MTLTPAMIFFLIFLILLIILIVSAVRNRILFRMAYRVLSGYIRSPAFRDYMKARGPIPKNLFQYLGYGIYVGRKPQ